MTDEEFWGVIASSRLPLRKEDDGENVERQEAELKRLLTALPAEQVAGFADRFQFFSPIGVSQEEMKEVVEPRPRLY